MRAFICCVLLVASVPVYAQPQPVNKWADWASYGTAPVNVTIGVVDAWQSERRGCHLAQLALSEAVGNGTAIGVKHYVTSPRPCLGCSADGMPSAHTMNSVIGINQAHPASSWKGRLIVGVTAAALTGLLRWQANRHTWEQIGWGALLGVGAELSGQIIRCD
jgi:hypothetical protein